MSAPKSSRSGCLAALLAAAQIASAAPALAQDAPVDDGEDRIVLELNNATDTDNGDCRMTFVAANNMQSDFLRTGWQVGIFDAQGIVRSILALEFGALPAGKTKIVLFDLPGRRCADISRVVVNDVTLCQPDTGAEGEISPDCLDALTTRSRSDIDFGI